MIKLSYREKHKSITELPDVVLPDFVVLTGPNGSGKTHLLEAIRNGHVVVDDIPEPNESNIRLFDWTSMAPAEGPPTDGSEDLREAHALYEMLLSMTLDEEVALMSAARSAGLPPQHTNTANKILRLSDADIRRHSGGDGADDAISILTKAKQHAANRILPRMSQQSRRSIDRVLVASGKELLALQRQDFIDALTMGWGGVGVFQQSFARLFTKYRRAWSGNQVRQNQMSKGRADTGALSDADFTKRYGPPPWDFLEEVFRASNLNFTVTRPPEFDSATFVPKLIKKSTGAEVSFEWLSSGERIIMSFAFCLYYSSDVRQTTEYPKLLLFDEVDAPLHPSMTQSFLRAATEVLVGTHGVKIIATTHSPSTVALAPEGSVFVMDTDPTRLSSVSKSEALNALTAGVPTLALSFEGRRQVFVESDIDAGLYARLYEVLKGQLGSPRSLEFIGTGLRKKGGDINSGCDVVRSIVNKIHDAGNRSVYGLIDWDGVNEQDERIVVLSEGKRDGLENILLDPLLLGATLVRVDAQAAGESLRMEQVPSYLEFLTADAPMLQEFAHRVQAKVIGPPTSDEKMTAADYGDGLTLTLRESYLLTDDHKLESLVDKAFPWLRRVASGHPSALLHYVVEHTIKDSPRFLPSSIRSAFLQLLSGDSH